MNEFKDDVGRLWSIRVTMDTCRRVKTDTGVMLTDVVDPKSETLKILTSDLIAMFDVLVSVVRPQIDERNLTVEQFAEALTEQSIDDATCALVHGIADFFPKDRAQILSTAFDRTANVLKRIQRRGIAEATEAMNREDFDETIEAAILSTLGNTDSK